MNVQFWQNSCSMLSMKNRLILLLILSLNYSFGQDTLNSYKLFTGNTQSFIRNGSDSAFHIHYESGAIESIRSFSIKDSIQTYTRYYENGTIMLSSKLLRNKLHDTCSYYKENGDLVAQFKYDRGNITDTLFMDQISNFIIGRATYYSVVYGGMVREDGRSNVRGGDGTYMFTKFYTVLHQENVQPVKFKSFVTDFDGNYFVILTKGNFGIYPETFNIEKVLPNSGSPGQSGGPSSFSSWNIDGAITINDQFNFVIQNIHFESVGYAP